LGKFKFQSDWFLKGIWNNGWKFTQRDHKLKILKLYNKKLRTTDDEKLREHMHSLCNLQKNLKHCNFIGCHPWEMYVSMFPRKAGCTNSLSPYKRSGSKLYSLGQQLNFMKEIGPSCTRMDVFHGELSVSSRRKKTWSPLWGKFCQVAHGKHPNNQFSSRNMIM
jgi:hypothetical protein